MALGIPFARLSPALTESLLVVTRKAGTVNDRGRLEPGGISHVTVTGVTMPPSRGSYPELFDQSSGQRVEDMRVFYLDSDVDITLGQEAYVRHSDIFYRVRPLASWPGYLHLIGIAETVDFVIGAGRAFSSGFSRGFA